MEDPVIKKLKDQVIEYQNELLQLQDKEYISNKMYSKKDVESINKTLNDKIDAAQNRIIKLRQLDLFKQ